MCAVIGWQGGHQSIVIMGSARMPHGWTGLAQSNMEQASMIQATTAQLSKQGRQGRRFRRQCAREGHAAGADSTARSRAGDRLLAGPTPNRTAHAGGEGARGNWQGRSPRRRGAHWFDAEESRVGPTRFRERAWSKARSCVAAWRFPVGASDEHADPHSVRSSDRLRGSNLHYFLRV